MGYYDDDVDDGSTRIKIDKVPGEIKLDECCWQCGGYDYKTYQMKKVDPNCDVCHGKGYQLTETGQKILDFLKRWQS
jgi:Tryptophan RNA-binding attenuator protein inhibitory protein